MGAVNELPPFTIEVDSVVETTDESAVGNASATAVPFAVTDGVGFDSPAAGPATTELSSVGNSGGAVAFGGGEALPATSALSGLCGNAGVPAGLTFSSAAC